MPIKGRSRFVAIAERDERGRMAWRVFWDGNHDSKAGPLRYRRCLQCDAYARMVEVLRHGCRGVQADLSPPGLTPIRLVPASPGASPAGAGHPGKA